MDSSGTAIYYKVLSYGLVAFLLGLIVHAATIGNKEGAIWIICVPLPLSLVFAWWMSGFKRVELDGEWLIIRNGRQEDRVPISSVDHVNEHVFRVPTITLVFRTNTKFGRRVRIAPKLYGVQVHALVEELRAAVRESQGRESI